MERGLITQEQLCLPSLLQQQCVLPETLPFPLSKSREASAEMRESALRPQDVAQGSWVCRGASWDSNSRKRSPRGEFSSQERSIQGCGGGRGICKSSNKHQTSPFIPHSFGGGEQRRHLYLGNSETKITLNPALFLLIA